MRDILKNIIKEELEKVNKFKKKFGCLMLYFDDIKIWDKIIDLIPNDIVYGTRNDGYGKENEPHVTVLYGFHDDKVNIEDIKKITDKIKIPIKVKLDGISIFENKDFDVLKFDISSDELVNLNKKFRENFDYSSDYPDYHPHLTIAYLKKGEGDKIIKQFKDTDIHLKSSKFVYSGINRKESWKI